MQIILRDYQERGINDLRLAIRAGHKSVLYQLPCGGGKTVLLAFMARNAAERGHRTIFTVHRKELLEQSSRCLSALNLPHGIIAPGHTMTADKIQVASIDTLRNRLAMIPAPKILCLDECHHSTAKTWARIVDHYQESIKIGLTATPYRLSGEPLSDIFTTLVQGPAMRELINKGYLSDYDYYAPNSGFDKSGLKIRFGDYIKAEIEQATNKPVITGNCVQHYLRLANNKSCIVFCCTIKHSKTVANEFKKYGISAEHIDGTMIKYNRNAIISGFRAGSIKIICNVDLISEGFDLSGVNCVSLLRPTKSLALFIQQTGRALRPSDSQAVIIDHVNNIQNFGFPDMQRNWSLSGDQKPKKDKEFIPHVRQCPACYFVFSVSKTHCPQCGAEWVPSREELKQIEGNLEKLEREKQEHIKQQQRRERWIEEKECRSLEDFERLAKQRGYKLGWAYHRWKYKSMAMRRHAAKNLNFNFGT